MCVNALYRAHFISTTIKLDTQKTSADRCQCPISGALHFYAQLYSKVCQDGYVCQCPISGALHFYATIAESILYNGDVSMPYIGRTSFLPHDAIPITLPSGVSMPYIGRTSFLLTADDRIKVLNNGLCQCPISGALHFYGGLLGVRTECPHVSMPYIGRTSFLQTQSVFSIRYIL